MRKDWAIGQELYFVPAQQHGGLPRYVKVTRVGNKYITLENGWRVDMETMRVDGRGYSSPGKCWENEPTYFKWLELENAWRKLQNWMSREYHAPDGVTIESIATASILLKAESKKEGTCQQSQE